MGGLGRMGARRLRRSALPLAAMTLGLAAWWFFREEKALPASPPKVAQGRPRPQPVPPSEAEPAVPVDHPVLESSSRFQSVGSTAEEDFEIVTAVIENYRRVYGGNPVGENEEIFTALRGGNPKGIRFLPNQFPGLQEDGSVLDRWGTPWRFHALSGHEMEVFSAGPDRTFGTADDLGEGSSP